MEKETRGSGSLFIRRKGREKRSLRRDHVIIYRLTAADKGNVRLREAGGETLGDAVGVGLGHVLAVVHGEEFRMPS